MSVEKANLRSANKRTPIVHMIIQFLNFLKSILDFIYFFPKAFREAIKLAVKYKENSTDFMDEVLRELEVLADKMQFNVVLVE